MVLVKGEITMNICKTGTRCTSSTDSGLPHEKELEIASRQDFYIFTSLLWIRKSDTDIDLETQRNESFGAPNGQSGPTFPASLDWTCPDLGLLALHRDRLADAAKALEWNDVQALDRSSAGLQILRARILEHVRSLPPLKTPDQIERRKVRAMVDRCGCVTVDSTLIDHSSISGTHRFCAQFLPRSLGIQKTQSESLILDAQNSKVPHSPICRVVIDTSPSTPSTFTTHKTSFREVYDAARARAQITSFAPTVKEVLLYNYDGEIMEASLCTVYFWRSGGWITPDVVCGGNLGVTRRMALENGLCTQGIIKLPEIERGELVWLSNGARGFFVGRIVLEDSASA